MSNAVSGATVNASSKQSRFFVCEKSRNTAMQSNEKCLLCSLSYWSIHFLWFRWKKVGVGGGAGGGGGGGGGGGKNNNQGNNPTKSIHLLYYFLFPASGKTVLLIKFDQKQTNESDSKASMSNSLGNKIHNNVVCNLKQVELYKQYWSISNTQIFKTQAHIKGNLRLTVKNKLFLTNNTLKTQDINIPGKIQKLSWIYDYHITCKNKLLHWQNRT